MDLDWFDLSEETRWEIRKDCLNFQEETGDILAEYPTTPQRDGHMFCLTRNGHGAGFWDGEYDDDGDELTNMSKPYGTMGLYLGDDGELYHHG